MHDCRPLLFVFMCMVLLFMFMLNIIEDLSNLEHRVEMLESMTEYKNPQSKGED